MGRILTPLAVLAIGIAGAFLQPAQAQTVRHGGIKISNLTDHDESYLKPEFRPATYPSRDAQGRRQALCIVSVDVSPDGRVNDSCTVCAVTGRNGQSRSGDFDRQLEQDVEDWRYAPFTPSVGEGWRTDVVQLIYYLQEREGDALVPKYPEALEALVYPDASSCNVHIEMDPEQAAQQ